MQQQNFAQCYATYCVQFAGHLHRVDRSQLILDGLRDDQHHNFWPGTKGRTPTEVAGRWGRGLLIWSLDCIGPDAATQMQFKTSGSLAKVEKGPSSEDVRGQAQPAHGLVCVVRHVALLQHGAWTRRNASRST